MRMIFVFKFSWSIRLKMKWCISFRKYSLKSDNFVHACDIILDSFIKRLITSKMVFFFIFSSEIFSADVIRDNEDSGLLIGHTENEENKISYKTTYTDEPTLTWDLPSAFARQYKKNKFSQTRARILKSLINIRINMMA